MCTGTCETQSLQYHGMTLFCAVKNARENTGDNDETERDIHGRTEKSIVTCQSPHKSNLGAALVRHSCSKSAHCTASEVAHLRRLRNPPGSKLQDPVSTSGSAPFYPGAQWPRQQQSPGVRFWALEWSPASPRMAARPPASGPGQPRATSS